ncbi:sorting nexin-22 [Austrofundulus limnaeus]|uniref:Sorting nexin-22 n=1 Tax=Austrofundulus limnaeus TaxID=52670 RepID=A0A2I4CR25_AUSLI|nr:PREDICTED: sorting nexin-22-like [Austrofundulus limnaeus]
MALQQEGVLMVQVSIPSTEDREVRDCGKPKKLRKILQLPDFPSKRNLHLRSKPVEQRRQELEGYLQDIIYQNEDVPQVLLDFLHLKHFHTGNKISSMESLDELDSQESNFELPNQPVLGFFQDPYLPECSSGLPDIIMDGVLQGFYPRDIRVSFNASTLHEHEPTRSVEA